MTLLLYLVFILSGAAGLIYESIWSRYLGLFVGHSAYAQIIVLIIFLGGMSIGAVFAGRRAERMRDPLLGYAAIELVVGIIGVAFHDVFQFASAFAYDTLFPALPAGAAVIVAKWVLAALLILPQSVLLGATFPLMSAGVLRRASKMPGRVLSLLYFANSLGAAVGVLLAGFWLIRLAGLPGTLLVAAGINILVALIVWAAVRMSARTLDTSLPVLDEAVEPYTLPSGMTLPSLRRLLLLVSFGTAVASFIYEIAWIRMLSLVLGSATHSFELMLSAFILGLALGAFWVRRRADEWRDPLRALATVQVMMGVLAVATLPIYVGSFYLSTELLAVLTHTEGGYITYSVTRYVICLAVMLPATFCAGMTLPIITRTLIRAGAGERSIGEVYGANTFGSIIGVSLAGLVLLPMLGLKLLQILGALGDMALGFWIFARTPATSTSGGGWRRLTGPRPRLEGASAEPAPSRGSVFGGRIPVAVVVLAVVALIVAFSTPFDTLIMTSGVYRNGRLLSHRSFKTLFYEDGRTATVTARANASNQHFSIATNGKPDASMRVIWKDRDTVTVGAHRLVEDEPTQLLLPLIALAHVPHAREAAMIGQGSGISSHIMLGSPHLKVLETVEIEPAMIRGSKTAFYPANKRVFDDPRARFVIDDAKSYFASAHRFYDVIVSEPSNPWVSGVSGLFTSEFYGRVRQYLRPGGVFGQWLHLYEIDDKLVLSVLAALHANFPSYEIFLVSNTDILIVASNAARLPRANWSVVQYPGVAEDLRPFFPITTEALEGMRLVRRETLAPLFEQGRNVNSDYFPHLDLGTERTRYLKEEAEGFINLNIGRLDIVAMIEDRRVPFDTTSSTPIPSIPRLRARESGARVRRAVHGGTDPLEGNTDVETAIFNWKQMQAAMSTGRAPASWDMWGRQWLGVERMVHAGTAGYADEAFFDETEAYLARAKAPVEMREVVAFQRAIARWDWQAISALTDSLITSTLRVERPLLPAETIHDVAVIARLKLGDVPGAVRVHQVMRSAMKRDDQDLRTQILLGQIAAARAAGLAKP